MTTKPSTYVENVPGANRAARRLDAAGHSADEAGDYYGQLRDVIDLSAPTGPAPNAMAGFGNAQFAKSIAATQPPHNAAEAEADDRRLLTSLAKIDDVDAKLWRLQERIAACEKNDQRMASRLDALAAPKGNPMVKMFLWGTGAVFVLVVVGLALRMALT